MVELVIASNNSGKLKEITHALKGTPFTVVSMKDALGPIEIAEPAKTLEGNALIKAMTVGKRTGKLALADDTGLAIDFLNGGPGVRTARYGATDALRNERILNDLKGLPMEKRGGTFTTVIALYDPVNDKFRVAHGTCAGRIATEPRGANSFGCAPIFYVDEIGKTMAEMTLDELAKVNHRGKALMKARELLLSEFV